MNTLHSEKRKDELFKYRIKFALDDDPDLSYLGEYTDRPTYDDKRLVIDRMQNGDQERHEYRYFVCAYDMQDARKWYHDHGYSKHDAYTLPLKHSKEDYERMEAYNNDDWHMIGIVVTCYERGEKVELYESSLWGIESNSDKTYLEDTIRELMAECKAGALKAIEEIKGAY